MLACPCRRSIYHGGQKLELGLTLPDLSPNPGLWWYFFTEMFDHFRLFFLVIVSVHSVKSGGFFQLLSQSDSTSLSEFVHFKRQVSCNLQKV
ncbi:hypothetical protein EDB19DRAFT_1637822 [Suillus lakei]|nr:hypothetical protein EDB19DRAFT_1637822 [Suillus lakei]